MEQVEAKWPFNAEYLVAVRRSGGAIEHYLEEAEDALKAREQVANALLDKLAVVVRVK